MATLAAALKNRADEQNHQDPSKICGKKGELAASLGAGLAAAKADVAVRSAALLVALGLGRLGEGLVRRAGVRVLVVAHVVGGGGSLGRGLGRRLGLGLGGGQIIKIRGPYTCAPPRSLMKSRLRSARP